ncbi:MAG: RsmD family RNA methyltransferase [Synergistales bacterium]|nr:RsmD family RNA methyltransferase [Synergistales bacterium]
MKDVRPTAGKVLQALFNILGPMAGRSFLDLFSGTGRVSLEAYKRGASSVYAIESVRSRCQNIRKTMAGETKEDLHLLCMDVRRALTWLSRKKLVFDIVFADPPYHEGWPGELLLLMEEKKEILRPGGELIIEHSVREMPPDTEEVFMLKDQRRYGDTILSFYISRTESDQILPLEGKR